jgi:type IV pilus assembly protein PilF
MLHKVITSLFIILLSACSHNRTPEKNPDQKKADIYYMYGTDSLLKQKYTEALDHLLKAYNLEPNNHLVLNNLGMAYYFKKDTAKALKYINRSLELNPQNSDARNNLASIYFHKSKFNEAKEQYQKILTHLTYKHQYRVHYNLGLISLKQNKWQNAESEFKLSVAEKDDYCPANYQLGKIKNRLNDSKRARDYFLKAMSGTCIKYPAPQFELANISLRKGRYKKARAQYLEIIERFPDTTYMVRAQSKLVQLKELINNVDLSKRGKYKNGKMKRLSPSGDGSFDSPNF